MHNLLQECGISYQHFFTSIGFCPHLHVTVHNLKAKTEIIVFYKIPQLCMYFQLTICNVKVAFVPFEAGSLTEALTWVGKVILTVLSLISMVGGLDAARLRIMSMWGYLLYSWFEKIGNKCYWQVSTTLSGVTNMKSYWRANKASRDYVDLHERSLV